MKKRLDTTLRFFWGGSYGSIYPTLNQLEKEGKVTKEDTSLNGAWEHIERFEEKCKSELFILNMFAENLTQYLEDDTHKHYYLTVKFGIKTYEAYLRWCEEAKKTNKEVGKEMKTAIIYYSMSGNTKYVAEKIANQIKEKVEVDIIRIEPEKAYPDKGAKKFLWGGKSAVMGEKPRLQPYEFSMEQYDRIIIGTPVWASNFAPPIRTFIHENQDVKGKKIAVFTCFSGGGAEKAIDKMRKYINVEKFEAELILIDPKENKNEEDDVKIEEFCSALEVRD